MPKFREMTWEEDRERRYELTLIRKLRRLDPERAAELWIEYQKEYFLQPPGPRPKKAREAHDSIDRKSAKSKV